MVYVDLNVQREFQKTGTILNSTPEGSKKHAET